jgi:hypothetical protein
MPMMAITTSNSTRVKPRGTRVIRVAQAGAGAWTMISILGPGTEEPARQAKTCIMLTESPAKGKPLGGTLRG